MFNLHKNVVKEHELNLIQSVLYLEFCVRVEDHLRQVRHGTGVHHSLRQLRRVFADVAEGGGRDAFQSHLWFPETEHQQGDGTRIHHGLSQHWRREEGCVNLQTRDGESDMEREWKSVLLTLIVSGDVAQSPGCGLLHPGVKILQAEDQSVHTPTGHHSLGQVGGVFGHSPKDKRCCFLIEPLHTKTHSRVSMTLHWFPADLL